MSIRSGRLNGSWWTWLAWWDLARVAFAGLNLAAMQVMSTDRLATAREKDGLQLGYSWTVTAFTSV